jgi:DNA adenine methylase
MSVSQTKNNYIKSPLNYIGGKQKILNQILPLFPSKINQFVDLFSGGCNVGINVEAKKKIYLNDNLTYLVEMYRSFQNLDLQSILDHIESRIKKYKLSITNEDGYKKIRELYNNKKNPLDLFLLICYSFNHQIRFNNSHGFNNPFGKNRSSFNESIKQNLKNFHERLSQKKFELTCNSFEKFDFSLLGVNDFVYCDPPYLITTGSYNDGKRGFKGWTKNEEITLLEILDDLNKSGIKFALSNVLNHKGKSNDLLKDWLQAKKTYKVNYLDKNYANSNYRTIIRDKCASTEVLITNYDPTLEHKWIIQTQKHNEIYRK